MVVEGWLAGGQRVAIVGARVLLEDLQVELRLIIFVVVQTDVFLALPVEGVKIEDTDAGLVGAAIFSRGPRRKDRERRLVLFEEARRFGEPDPAGSRGSRVLCGHCRFNYCTELELLCGII